MLSALLTPSLFVAIVLLCETALGINILTISSASELIAFSNDVNNGTRYSKTTVYLSSDIVFTEELSLQFVPIGNKTKYFAGTFDGQGHTISSLALNPALQYVGLFGYTEGATIRNVVMDETCSFTSYYISYDLNTVDVGSICGYCSSSVIENVVNMGNVTFSGTSSSRNFHMGGFVGRLIDPSTVKNCVNYGPVTFSESASGTGSSIGGLVGFCGGTGIKFIQNCANYGTVAYNAVSGYPYMGGIVGTIWYGAVSIENCVCGGVLVNSRQASGDNHVGTIVREIYSETETNITHCLWTSDVGYEDAVGYDETTSTSITDSSLITTIDITTVDGLNKYAEKDSTWSSWLLLHLNGGGIGNLSQSELAVTQKHFPAPTREGYTFLFWCKDSECTERYDPSSTAGVTELYAVWNINNYTLTFIFDNGIEPEVGVLDFNETIAYPDNPVREGYIFAGWSPNPERMPAQDVTAIAQWATNYTLTFVFGNGIEPEVRVLDFNTTIAYPDDPVREGYTFAGWSPNPERMPAHDVTVTAQWNVTKPSKYVEIVFGKDMKEEDIREVIRGYTQEDFTIKGIDVDEETGETKVVVKFANNEKAEEFVQRVSDSEGSVGDSIKSVNIVPDYDNSFSAALAPFLFNLFAFI